MHRTGYGSDDLRGVDRRENACPPVAYISDLIRVSPHVFQLVEKWSPERNNNYRTEQNDRNRQKTRRISNEPPMTQRPPQKKKDRVTAAFQSGAFSHFPPWSNCLFSSLPLSLSLGLWPCCRKVMSAVVVVLLVPARVSTHSVGEEMPLP